MNVMSSQFISKIEDFKSGKTTILNEYYSRSKKINDTHSFIVSFSHLTNEAEAYRAKAVLVSEKIRNDELNMLRNQVIELLSEFI